MEPATGLEQFFDAAERLVADYGANPAAFARIGDLLRIVADDATLIDESKLDALHQSSAQATILGHGPAGSTLMLGRFSAEAPTPVHNHNSWGVLCVVRGRDRHILWRRQDDGQQAVQAQLQIIETLALDPGDVALFPAIPGGLYRQQVMRE